MNLLKRKVDKLNVLPTTPEGLDSFVADIIKEFGLPNNDDTYDNIATMIMHVPPSACRVPMRYFGESVLKSMANKVAFDKLAEFRDKRKAAAEAAKLAELPKESANVQPVQNSEV